MPPEIQVFDTAGNPRTIEWLREKYGPFRIHNPPPIPEGETAQVWRITALREKCNAAAAIVVRTLDEDGNPLEGVQVCWYWGGARPDPDAGPMGAPYPDIAPNQNDGGPTNSNGDVGFAMGTAAYYHAELGIRGPHAVWIRGYSTRSDLFDGLGMLPGTTHDHIDVEYTLFEEEGGEEPKPEPLDPILAELANIVAQLIRIADSLPYLLPPPEDAAND